MKRVTSGHSTHHEVRDVGVHVHHWRVIECDGTTDVCKCSICGEQRKFPCDFDDDYA